MNVSTYQAFPELKPVGFGAKRLGVPVMRLYGLIREGVIPAGVVVRLGRSIRINPVELESFIRSGGMSLAGGWRRRTD